jgi:hypothetical protein
MQPVACRWPIAVATSCDRWRDASAVTPEEVAAVEAEVSGKALDRAIEAIKLTVRSSGRQKVDTAKIRANKELGQKL